MEVSREMIRRHFEPGTNDKVHLAGVGTYGCFIVEICAFDSFPSGKGRVRTFVSRGFGQTC